MSTRRLGSRLGMLAGCSLVLACTAINLVAPTATLPPSPLPPSPKTTAPPMPAEASATSDQSPTATETAEPTGTSAPTMASTSAPVSMLKGQVLQRSNCRYGPGAFFLSKIGMLAGATIEALGRNIDGGWAYIQFSGTHNLCWINSKLIRVDGDVMALQDVYPDKAPLPRTGKFSGATVTSVSGGPASITVEWSPVVLPEIAMPGGANETEYVVEVWTCRNGVPGYTTYGTNDTSLTFEVDDSCGMTSRANLVTQTVVGVSGIASIALP